jgi:phosphoglycolate phosphatase-like HAD superfamily hydrolase
MAPATQAPPLVLFDIDGTLVRRSGPHHREALVEAVRRITGIDTTTDDVPVAGMLDRDILTIMMQRAGMKAAAIRTAMPDIVARAQYLYARTCPDLKSKVCPGVKRLLPRILKRGIVTGLVTGNLTRIGWKKLERAGLKPYFRFGAFAEVAKDRAGLVKIAMREARLQKWIAKGSRVTLIGDHPNDVNAARKNGVRSIAVATGPATYAELLEHAPDVLLPDLRALDLEMLL